MHHQQNSKCFPKGFGNFQELCQCRPKAHLALHHVSKNSLVCYIRNSVKQSVKVRRTPAFAPTGPHTARNTTSLPVQKDHPSSPSPSPLHKSGLAHSSGQLSSLSRAAERQKTPAFVDPPAPTPAWERKRSYFPKPGMGRAEASVSPDPPTPPLPFGLGMRPASPSR